MVIFLKEGAHFMRWLIKISLR